MLPFRPGKLMENPSPPAAQIGKGKGRTRRGDAVVQAAGISDQNDLFWRKTDLGFPLSEMKWEMP